ncbi:hypothetical protein FGO68_gene6630 [Halteria grandinella]|uniref:Uncharacterized protein n=1 Tax=Halteria grandinella TaxID=5974 RepID=A0A8J8NNA1_HALGN|nr:hypothetical protein FGO68_gene6630 [Halteria grandinella]
MRSNQIILFRGLCRSHLTLYLLINYQLHRQIKFPLKWRQYRGWFRRMLRHSGQIRTTLSYPIFVNEFYHLLSSVVELLEIIFIDLFCRPNLSLLFIIARVAKFLVFLCFDTHLKALPAFREEANPWFYIYWFDVMLICQELKIRLFNLLQPRMLALITILRRLLIMPHSMIPPIVKIAE